MNANDVFGDVISSYSRKQALEDGVLVDLSGPYPDDTKIFRFPVACTAALWDLLSGGRPAQGQKEFAAWVWDLCWMATKCVTSRPDPTTVLFKVILQDQRTHLLKAVCGPNDDLSPCLTFMLSSED